MTPCRFLNVDLDLTSCADLTPLAREFELAGMLQLTLHREGTLWVARFELGEEMEGLEEPGPVIEKLVAHIEALSPSSAAIWRRCEMRRLDMGYESGEGETLLHTLSPLLLARLAALSVALGMTFYPSGGG